ncbi:MAG TPA: hypothetical protein VEU96_17325 [Bryobacteraceae bacterium]|nr:hypothetical protein [Bryobacteraceae bacterium]
MSIRPQMAVALPAVGLFSANAYVCRELFRTEYLAQLGSIEAAFISIARYAAANLTDLSWFPLWYNGIPYQNSYPPLLHFMVAVLARLTGWSAALSYHAVTAFFYCLGAVTVYFLCLYLSRSVAYSSLAGTLYSVLSPSAFLIADVRHDLGSVWHPRRLQTLLVYGEGPHIAGLALLPIAVIALGWCVNRRHPFWTVLAALSFAATALTNWLAAVALAAAVIAYLVAKRTRTAVVRTATASVLAYAFAVPWMPPSTIRVIESNAKTIGGDYTHIFKTLPLYGSFLLVGIIIVALLTRKASMIVQWSTVFTFIMAAISLSFAWFQAVIVPQPHRYYLEMELGLMVCSAFGIRSLSQRLPKRAQLAMVCIGLVGAIQLAKIERRYGRQLIREVDMAHTVEYSMSRWFDGHMQGRRVFAPGSISYWLNAFTDTPQVGGGFDQGTPNFLTRVLTYILYSSDATGARDAEISELWLKAYGVHAAGLGGPGSREYFKPWRNPGKFAGRLEELWHDGGDVIYRIPQRTDSLAHLMTRNGLAPRTPINGIDIDPLRNYVAALDDPVFPPASLRWSTRHSAVIEATIATGQILSVQITYDQGWHASRGTLSADSLGLIVLDPQCSGPCTITLTWDGGIEMKIARSLCWLAFAASILCVCVGHKFRWREV